MLTYYWSGNRKRAFGDGRSASDTHRPMLTTILFLTFQHVTMDIENHCVGVSKTAMNLGNDGTSFNVVANIGSGSARISR